SNEGRGYVLRRILRRAVRFGRQQLELKEPFLHKLVPVVVDAMGGAFPELKTDPKRVGDIIKDEEISFARTLDRGIELFDEAAIRGIVEAFQREEGATFIMQESVAHGTAGSKRDSNTRLVFRGMNDATFKFDPVYDLSDLVNELNIHWVGIA